MKVAVLASAALFVFAISVGMIAQQGQGSCPGGNSGGNPPMNPPNNPNNPNCPTPTAPCPWNNQGIPVCLNQCGNNTPGCTQNPDCAKNNDWGDCVNWQNIVDCCAAGNP